MILTPDGGEIEGPTQRADGKWVVTARDPLLGETAEKVFPSQSRAQMWLDALVSGTDAEDPLENSAACAEPARPGGIAFHANGTQLAANAKQLTGAHTRRDGRGQTSADAQANGAKFNLRAVREVLEDYGLDPFAELAQVLQRTETRKKRDAEGNVIEGEFEEVHVISGVDRAKVLVELGQYVQPKLKAVEMKVEDVTKLSEEQIDQRLGKLLSKLSYDEAGALLAKLKEGK